MNGQKKKYEEHIQLVKEYAERTNMFGKHASINFDLRGYNAYLQEHKMDGWNVPEEVAKEFELSPQ